jgi:formylglycine-generating enzyme required for sulfatase activity
MGSLSTDTYADVDEQPRHLVSLSPYYIDRFEVTRGEYTQCFLNGKCSALPLSCPFQNLASSNRPVLCVSWAQADDFCDWKGGMLPTEAEWEKAARGPFSRTTIWPSLAVGRSYYGVHHMAGNAAEWVDDYYDADFYTALLVTNPRQAANQGFGHVIRGGSYRQATELGRTSNRARLDFFGDPAEVGFRCMRTGP